MTEAPTFSVDEHQAQIVARSWPGVPDLAARWGVSRATVRKIPRDRLPYLDFGGTHIRRYDPADVASYEEREKQGAAA